MLEGGNALTHVTIPRYVNKFVTGPGVSFDKYSSTGGVDYMTSQIGEGQVS